ncbi:unnamed protein product [Schistosoma margrebowiei]|uniref:Uncharacterized protein n=1 Tax=Schistosoma margrebowiei TaxID=48269 RepID=A0A183LMM3_9TREM|nr:unnamed protein product [Schistosoma margrebowiei]
MKIWHESRLSDEFKTVLDIYRQCTDKIKHPDQNQASKMVVGSSQQDTLDLGFVLRSTRQQGEPVILRELMLLDGLDHVSPSKRRYH